MTNDDPTQVDARPLVDRVAFLGASNVTLGLPVLVNLVRSSSRRPLAIYSAHGMGRSYGIVSNVLGRSLPGILDSQLWSALEATPARSTVALITDIGNDLLYHQPPEKIVDWVEQCIDRLEGLGASISMTRLPIGRIRHFGPLRYYALRPFYFPSCRLSFDEVVRRAHELEQRVAELASRRQITAIEPDPSWYGLDVIHLRPRDWRIAWSRFLEPMRSQLDPQPTESRVERASLLGTAGECARSLHWMTKPPERRRILGVERRRSQPAIQFADGTAISIF